MSPSDAHERSSPSDERPSSRSFLPRFGLRSLFVFALLFCLLFGWIGRNAYRVRQEEAAIEALMQANGAIVLEGEEWRELHPATPARGTEPVRADWQELVARTLGRIERRPIREVVLHGEDPNDPKLARALASLAAFPEIRQMDLRGPALDDKAIAPLSKLKRLERLSMMGTTITGAGLKSLAASVPLQDLSISGEASSARLSEGVSALQELKSLRLEGLSIRRSDMETVASLPKLETLHLESLQPAPDEDVFAPLEKAENLRFFYESRSGMQEADLVALSRLPALEEAWIGIASDANVALLGPMPRLKKIYLNGPITLDGARSFSAGRPGVAVGYRIFTSDGRWLHAGKSEMDR
ncbi:MAG TPA: hypothetical protein VGN57_15860 [Pirellulaceae bacterium]|jgi:hypothetical protein|nr:hypothetical protein [Pirellulaceae bacterium]